MWSSAASCSISRKPEFTPAILPACCRRWIFPSVCLQRMREYTFKPGAGVEGCRADEYSVRDSAGECERGISAVQESTDGGKVYVMEVNPRASRTVPYVSKATGVPMAKIAARLMTGRKLREFLPEFIERRRRSRYRALLPREVSGVSVEQISRAWIRCLVRR